MIWFALDTFCIATSQAYTYANHIKVDKNIISDPNVSVSYQTVGIIPFEAVISTLSSLFSVFPFLFDRLPEDEKLVQIV